MVLEMDIDTCWFNAMTKDQVTSSAELNLLMQAMKLVKEMGLTSMDFESGCLQLVKMIVFLTRKYHSIT